MPGEDYILDRGANLSPSLGAYATIIEQAIERARPNSYRGMVVYSTTVPETIGQPTGYPTDWWDFQRRCLWLKSNNGELYYYNGTTWEYVRARPAYNSVTNDLISNQTIQFGKLSSVGGTARQLLRVATGGGFEFVSPANVLNPNELAVDKLASPATAVTSILQSVNGTKSWETLNSAYIVGKIDDNSIAVNKLARGAALQVPLVASDGNSVTWSSVISGIPDGAIGLGKFATSVGDAGKYLKYDANGKIIAADSGVTGTNAPLANSDKIVAITTAGTIKNATFGKYDSGLVALVAGTATYEGTHGLGVVPMLAQAFLECTVDEHGYVAGDRVDVSNIVWESAGDQRPALQLSINSTKWTLVLVSNAVAALTNIFIYVRSTGSPQAINPARWRLRVLLHNF